MTGKKFQIIPWVLGVVLIVVSVAGSNSFLDSKDKKTAPPAGPPLQGGVIVLGTVDSDPQPVRVGPPGIGMQVSTVKVFVNDGDEVQVGDPLVQFDDGIFQAKLKQAQADLAAAEEIKAKAEAQKQIHEITLDRQQKAIDQAKEELKTAENAYRISLDKFEAILAAERNLTTGLPIPEAEKQKRRDENVDLIQLEGLVTAVKAKLADESKKLDSLRLNPVDQDVKSAEAQIAGSEAKILEAQTYIDDCLVKARRTGIVEHVFAAPGMTYGPSTRDPLLWLIPTGKRVVRAEVEAEFAYKVADKVGRRVTVFDHSNFSLTYDGVVARVGTAFLPKRTIEDTIVVNPKRVLECLIEVTDPNPPGKPPLRVGQPVRVIFGE
jgi:multidrug efflux pump subunit AcrA (membrane-fusion protein)